MRYRFRGSRSPFEAIARSELQCAAKLFDKFCTNRVGWTLDLGAGAGGIWLFSTPPEKLIALDYAPQIAPFSTYRHRITADAAYLPFSNDTFSTILALGLLEYIPEIESTMLAWRSASKVGGKLLITNSPPTLPNRLRAWLGLGAITRSDSVIRGILSRNGWEIVENSEKRAGWQTLLVAEAVLLHENT